MSTLAKQVEPKNITDIVGQQHLFGENMPLSNAIQAKKISNYIFFGPPGTGKTLTANLIAKEMEAKFIKLNAVNCGVKDIRDIQKIAKEEKVLLFLDEIHRFNKAQQEVLLPDLEDGLYYFIGCTTQNPYFSLTPALNSRVIILNFEILSDKDLYIILEKGINAHNLKIDENCSEILIKKANGDGRKLLNFVEFIANSAQAGDINEEILNKVLGMNLKYNKDDHYEVISAFIKSIRGSDPDGATYWLARMLESGEDPLFIARRLVILASEDIGNAEPNGLNVAVSTMMAVKEIGMPEARIILSQATTYLASLPKSNASYLAINQALNDVKNKEVLAVPDHLKNKPKAKYNYPHDFQYGYVNQNYLPSEEKYYNPKEHGFEKNIRSYLNFVKSL